jgi:integrase
VQELLGHATIAITLDTYSHVLPNMQHEAVTAMQEVLLY